MTWNWQQSAWPHFRWDESVLAPLEALFLQNVGEQIGSIKHVDAEDRSTILIDMMTGEAIKTSEIEGELLDRDSVQSSLRQQFGLDTDRCRVPPAEAGIAEMMVDLYRNYAEPLSQDALHRWHRMIANGRIDLTGISAYRIGDPVPFIRNPRFLRHDAGLHVIGRRQRKELQTAGELRRPA